MLHVCRKVIALPAQLFTKHLLVANVSSAAVIGFMGDYVQQKIKAIQSSGEAQVDWKRTRNLALATSILSVEMHFWYKFLDRRFPTSKLKHVLVKVCLDELLMAPNFCFSMLALVNIFEGNNREKFISRLKNSFGIMYVADVCIFTPVQCINFYFLPTKYRTVFVYSASAIYLCIASYALHDVTGL